MKVAISGAHSQGKTTLVKALQDSGLLPEFKFKTSLTRGLQDAGLIINENGNDVTQLMVMAKHYQFLKEEGNIIYDRCALDGYAYSRALLEEGRVLSAINTLFSEMINQYDIIFYVEPELPLIEDGQRTIDKKFFDEVVLNFNYCIETFCIPVIRLSGTVEERVMQVITGIERWETQKTLYSYDPYEL